MSIFQCTKCGSAENTACCNYHYEVAILKVPPKCSACTEIPKTYDNKGAPGEWHDRFPRTFLPKGMFETDRVGNLVHKVNKDSYHKYKLEKEEGT